MTFLTHINLVIGRSSFATVDHQILLKKLELLGFCDKINNHIKSNLSDRKQYVLWGNSKLEQKSITYGVPQGSILGPLLFIFYVNDLPSATTDCKIVFYADDTCLFCSGKKSGVFLEKY